MASKATEEHIERTTLDLLKQYALPWEYEADWALPESGKRKQIRDEKHNAPKREVERIRAALAAGRRVPPVVVTRDGYYVDGNTRGGAFEKNGIRRAHAIVLQVDFEKASPDVQRKLKGLGSALNIVHGNRLAPEEVRDAVLTLAEDPTLAQYPGRIAELLGEPKNSVTRILRLERGRSFLKAQGHEPNGNLTGGQLSVFATRFKDWHAEPAKKIADVAMAADLTADELKDLARKVEATSSDTEAMQVLTAEEGQLADRVRRVSFHGRGKPTVANKMRRAFGIVTGLTESAGVEAVELAIDDDPSSAQSYLDELDKVLGRLNRLRALQANQSFDVELSNDAADETGGMSAAALRRERRARLASNDEREGGGFTLPSFIMAAAETIMDAGDNGVELGPIVDAVAIAASTDKSRIHHIWKRDTREASMTAMVEDLVQELIDAEYVTWAGERLVMVANWQQRAKAEDSGHMIRLNLQPHGTHRALVLDQGQRAERAERERIEFNLRTALNYITKPRLGSKESQARIEQLAESMRATGYDRTKPVIIGDDGVVIAGHHRDAAAELAGVTPATIVVAGLEDQIRAVWRDNDGRQWTTSERQQIAQALDAKGRTQQEIAEALNTTQATISRDLNANGQQPKRPTKRRDPFFREQVARLRAEGLSGEEMGRQIDGISKTTIYAIIEDLEVENEILDRVEPGADSEVMHVHNLGTTPEIDPPQIEQSEPEVEPEVDPEPETCSCCGQVIQRKTTPA